MVTSILSVLCAPALGETGLPWTKIILSALVILAAAAMVVVVYYKGNK